MMSSHKIHTYLLPSRYFTSAWGSDEELLLTRVRPQKSLTPRILNLHLMTTPTNKVYNEIITQPIIRPYWTVHCYEKRPVWERQEIDHDKYNKHSSQTTQKYFLFIHAQNILLYSAKYLLNKIKTLLTNIYRN